MRAWHRLGYIWAILFALQAGSLFGGEMSVQVKETQLRSIPSYLGKPAGTVNYGDRLSVLEKKSGWCRVQSSVGSGWIHESALTAKTIKVASSGQDISRTASSDELALAGKGFNSDVEAEFKNRNDEIDFTWVDRMESFKVDEAATRAFFEEGGLGVEDVP